MEDNQIVVNFKKEYEALKHYLITPVWNENAYREWLEEEHNLIYSSNIKE